MKHVIQTAVLLVISIILSNASADDSTVPAIQAIDQWNSKLVDEVRGVKFCKMASSPFVFLRGSNHLFWQQYANDPRLTKFGSSKTKIWLQGDLHAENFGAFDNDQGEVVYSVNDFDAAVIADYQFDVWRMAVSIVLVARQNEKLENKPLEITQDQLEEVIDEFAESYLDTLASYRGNDKETQSYFTAKTTKGALSKFLKQTAKKESRVKMLNKWCSKKNNVRKFNLDDDRLDKVDLAVRKQIEHVIDDYRKTLRGDLKDNRDYFKVKDVAKRLRAGTGSIGTPRYYVLIEAKSDDPDDDRILDVKKQGAPPPPAYTFLGDDFRRQYDKNFGNHAQRHAKAFQALTKHTDDHLGWMQLSDGFYSVRERSPFKKTYDTTKLTSVKRFKSFARQWGAVLATAHGGADKDADKKLISYSFEKEVGEATDGKHKGFRQLVNEVAFEFADQVQRDYEQFVKQRKPVNCNDVD